jgi:hypothetical protein
MLFVRFATGAVLFPTMAETVSPLRRRWRDALFESPFQSSFQACLYVVPQGWARLLPTARTLLTRPIPAAPGRGLFPTEHRLTNDPPS